MSDNNRNTDNLALEESSLKTGCLLYTREKSFINETSMKKTASMKQAYLRDTLWYLLTPSPGPSTSSAYKTPENINEGPDDLNQHRKEISK
jgi:hypothetical protein